MCQDGRTGGACFRIAPRGSTTVSPLPQSVLLCYLHDHGLRSSDTASTLESAGTWNPSHGRYRHSLEQLRHIGKDCRLESLRDIGGSQYFGGLLPSFDCPEKKRTPFPVLRSGKRGFAAGGDGDFIHHSDKTNHRSQRHFAPVCGSPLCGHFGSFHA